MLVPLYGFLRGDALGVVVLVQDYDSVSTVAATLQQACAVRVAPRAPGTKMAVYFRGQRLDANLSVAAAGLTALDCIDVAPEDA